MANKFKAGMMDLIEVLNQMWDAFSAGPYNALPLGGGTMTGPLGNISGIYVNSQANTFAAATSLRNIYSGPDATGDQFRLAATIGVRGIPNLAHHGQWEVVTSSGTSGLWNGHTLSFTASDVYSGAGTVAALQLRGNGSARVGTDLIVPGVVYAGIENTEQQGVVKLRVANSGYFSVCAGAYASQRGAALTLAVNTVNGRSLDAPGTVNAAGADYAEYMLKSAACGVVVPGQVIGIDVDGRLTDEWADAVSFAVKSTNPCMVGGDVWSTHLGDRPEPPAPVEPLPAPPERALPVGDDTGDTDDEWANTLAIYASMLSTHRMATAAFDLAKAEYDVSSAQFDAALEAARQKVDRIAFAGQVPVNLQGTAPGQYIVPVQDDDGITGAAVNEADMTLAQYMRAIGRVIAIEDDGRARIIVKVA